MTAGYRTWVRDHALGYVLNTDRQPRAGYLKLHRTTCHTISGQPVAGSRWTVLYSKLCSNDPAELMSWAQAATGGTPDRCRFCLGE